MTGKKKGFTLVEVTIFLALTGLLFFAVTIGVQNSIFQQRYNDTVQSFADFLRNIYADTTNVQNDKEKGGGRSKKAMYGKLVVFENEKNADGRQVFRVYDVVGEAKSSANLSSGTTLGILKALALDVKVDGQLVGFQEDYSPKWGAEVQKVEATGGAFQDFTGSILVVRNPRSGTVQTFVSDEIIDVDRDVFGEGGAKLNSFKTEDVDFCINPNPEDKDVRRADVRLADGASNASDVEVYMYDNETEGGNRCNGD